MKTEIDYSLVPFNYLLCLKRECTLAETCLRQLLEDGIPANIQHWHVLSPKYLASIEGACPYYRPSTNLRYAKGFVNFFENLPHHQMRIAVASLKKHFGVREYYRTRKGEKLISPSEQEEIIAILKKCNITQKLEFDHYINNFDW